jgi:hypothetical protein
MALKVIGAGLGRTGTLSMKLALEMLGLGPCYHMVEVFKNPPHANLWSAAADGPGDWDAIYQGYQSTVDWPSAHFWRELTNRYPDAKVILTIRSTESWINSMQQTILKVLQAGPPEGIPVDDARLHMVQKIVRERAFGGKVDDLAHVAAVYERHNEEVRRSIAADRLLVFEAKQGWEPLCKFLGVPVPDAPYPKVNSAEEFGKGVPH